MNNLPPRNSSTGRSNSSLCLAMILLAISLVVTPVTATTYLSAEPIPNRDVVGQDNLTSIQSIGFANLQLWSKRLLNECRIVNNVIDVLSEHRAIGTVEPGRNTNFLVGAGGFEGVTNPSYVFTIEDTGRLGVSEADVGVLSNALGFVLSQGGTAHFSPDNPKAYAFSLDYAVVTFGGTLTGEEAGAFFKSLENFNPALFSGMFAGFTQIDFNGSTTNNSMLFLKPAATKRQLISGLSAAADAASDATYVTVNNNGAPTTDKAGIAFPGNDWIGFPNGDQYLVNLVNPSQQLFDELAALRQKHLIAVTSLLAAIAKGDADKYLNHQFKCP